MSTVRYIGGSVAVKQVTKWVLSGSWLAADNVTFTIGNKTYVVAAGDTTLAGILTQLTNAFNTLDQATYPEFAREIVLSNDGTNTLFATAVTAGEPFTMALSTSGSGVITGPTAVTASSGPGHWDTAANWSGGAVPVASDDVVVDLPGAVIASGLAQSSVVLNSLLVAVGCQIGRPESNPAGYFEYRATYLAIGVATATFTADVGSSSCLFRLDPGSHTTTINVLGMGPPASSATYALQIKGSGSNYTLNIQQGIVGVAVDPGEVATLPTVRVGYENSPSSDVVLVLGSGCTNTTINQFGGSVTVNSSVTTWNATAGSQTVLGAAAVGTFTVWPASGQASLVTYESTGTITTLVLAARATFDCERSLLGRTVTNCTVYAGATIKDGFRTVTFTNPPSFKCDPFADVTISRGANYTLAI